MGPPGGWEPQSLPRRGGPPLPHHRPWATLHGRGVVPSSPLSCTPRCGSFTQPRVLNHHPLCPCPGTGCCHPSPGNGPRPPHPPVTKGIFPKHMSDPALPSSAFGDTPSPSVWHKHPLQPLPAYLPGCGCADPPHRTTSCSPVPLASFHTSSPLHHCAF